MNAIHIFRQLDGETLHLPELRPLIGKRIEIIVQEDFSTPAIPKAATPYDAFFALSGTDSVDPEAYKELRAASKL